MISECIFMAALKRPRMLPNLDIIVIGQESYHPKLAFQFCRDVQNDDYTLIRLKNTKHPSTDEYLFLCRFENLTYAS